MANLMLFSFFCLVFILPSLPRSGAIGKFWRKQKPKPKPTLLPPVSKNPEFYRKLRENIPPLKETAKKMIKNLFRVTPAGKRAVEEEDTVIVLDGSASIGKCEFGNGKKALKSLMEYDNPEVDEKYAMVTFSSDVNEDFAFIPQPSAVYEIDKVKYPNGATNTQAGLAAALELFKKGRGFGSRKVVLLLTDGQSNIEQAKTIPNAQKLKAKGVEVFVVAIGGKQMDGIDEMAHIASYPPADFLFRVAKVGDFLKVVNLAIKEVAPNKYKILDKQVPSCL